VPQPAAFFAASALESVGYLDEQWQMIMDYELCIRLGMRFPAVCIPEALAQFRIHAASKTRSSGEATMRELMHFAATFFAEPPAMPDIRAIRRVTLSRIHYERSLVYAGRERRLTYRALRALRASVMLAPSFALRRPRQTAYLIKELLRGYISR
jgi:GT2 family glycosyltransferase